PCSPAVGPARPRWLIARRRRRPPRVVERVIPRLVHVARLRLPGPAVVRRRGGLGLPRLLAFLRRPARVGVLRVEVVGEVDEPLLPLLLPRGELLLAPPDRLDVLRRDGRPLALRQEEEVREHL